MNLPAERCVYVATGDGHLCVYELFDLDKPLRLRERVLAGAMPSFWAFARRQRRAFAVNEDSNHLVACSVDESTLAPAVLANVPCPGGPAYVALDRSERWVFAANYGGGSVNVFRVAPDGTLAPSHQTLITGKNAHCIIADASNRWVFVPNRGADSISQLCFDAETGTLVPNAVPEVRSALGAGPRHLVFHPAGHVAYVVNEDASTLAAYAFDADSGRLALLQTISTLPEAADPTGNTGAHVQVHPSGRFVYASNRGHDSIAVFAIDVATGKLTWRSQHSSQGKIPRTFAINQTGELLLTANQGSASLTLYNIDPDTGALLPRAVTQVGSAAFWVDFAQA